MKRIEILPIDRNCKDLDRIYQINDEAFPEYERIPTDHLTSAIHILVTRRCPRNFRPVFTPIQVSDFEPLGVLVMVRIAFSP